MRANQSNQAGFTLVEIIVVVVITSIIGGIVAIFIQVPVQGYVDSARRAALTDIADTAMRRMERDVRTAVPNSVRVANCGATPCIEYMPTRDGGRYRASAGTTTVGCGSVTADILDFTVADSCFAILGTPITINAGDQIVVGSTQSNGNPPYQNPTAAACGVAATTTCIRRPVSATGTSLVVVHVTSSYPLPGFSALDSQRFDVVDGAQQAVTYSCEGPANGTDASGNGTGVLKRYWFYGFYVAQPTPPITVQAPVPGNAGAVQSAILADKVDCTKSNIVYNVVDPRFGLLEVWLTLTSNNESVSLYNEIHVNNSP